MRIRLNTDVFVRHINDESLVWCPRSGGCTVFKDAKTFLDSLSKEWQDRDVMLRMISEHVACSKEELVDDFDGFICELSNQSFVEITDGVDKIESVIEADSKNPEIEDDRADEMSPVGAFYLRHGVPSELHIDLTDKCNERCIHCYIPKNGGVFINKELAFKVLSEFREAQGGVVYVSGGECMCHPDFKEIVKYINDIGLNIILMSNLVLCNESMVQFLKQIRPQFVNVSLYSMNPREHDEITRLNGSWKRTYDAILRLVDACIPVRIATPIMTVNGDAVEEVSAFAKQIGSHALFDCDIFGRIDHNDANRRCALGVSELEPIVRKYKELLCRRPMGHERCLPDCKTCDIGELRLNVNAYGRYYPCDGFHGMVLGNANDTTLMEVWRGAPLNRLRLMKNKDFGECARCEKRPWCKVCAMRNFNETGDMFTHSPHRCELARIYKTTWEGR